MEASKALLTRVFPQIVSTPHLDLASGHQDDEGDGVWRWLKRAPLQTHFLLLLNKKRDVLDIKDPSQTSPNSEEKMEASCIFGGD